MLAMTLVPRRANAWRVSPDEAPMQRMCGWLVNGSPPAAPAVSQKQRLSPSSQRAKGSASHAGERPVLNSSLWLPRLSN